MSARKVPSGRRRTAARLAAVQALYQIEVAAAPVEAVIAEFIHHRLGQEGEGERFGDAEPQFFVDLVRGTAARQAEIDPLLRAALAPDWPLERLETVLRAILRAGAFELAFRGDLPIPVIISEYLDIGHAFFAGKEPGLVNGVLDRIARTVRPREHEGGASDGGAAA